MTIRTTSKTVTFTKPFALREIDSILPAGTYTVDTDEELIGDRSIVAYRRVATMIHVQRNGVAQVFRIDPVELDADLMRDADLTVSPRDTVYGSVRRSHPRSASMSSMSAISPRPWSTSISAPGGG